ncbi:MAG: c-type cytochrome biogenesis protein CcmI [Aliishimia sp.]
MIFWFLIGALALGVCAILGSALHRGAQNSQPAAAFDLKVYRDQLGEVDRDLARGIVNEEDAERARTEISRRILSADSAIQSAQVKDATETDRGTIAIATLVGAILLGGSGYLYSTLGAPGYGDLSLKDRIAQAEILRADRPDQAQAETGLTQADLPPVSEPSADYVALVEQLREVVANRPDDLRGLRLLTVSERNMGNFSAASEAFEHYVTLRGDEAQPQEFADLADIMVLAAGGYVSPEAEAALTKALEGDPSNGAARYYWGLMLAQTGRPDQAFRIWDQLLRAGPPDAPWIPPVQAQIEDMAVRAGVNYIMPEPGSALRGPNADDIANAGDLSASDRVQMIAGMVDSLAERLSTEGGNVSEWAQLITALGVLERRNDAFAVYQNALDVFAEDLSAIDQINRAADRAGVAN